MAKARAKGKPEAGTQPPGPPPRVLIIAGADPSGGAGIQADTKTVMALGGYATSAITALTAQDTKGVRGIVEVDPFFVEKQVQLLLSDIGADAIKIGMLASVHTLELIARQLEAHARGTPIVLDPVLHSSSGAALFPEAGLKMLRERLLPQVALITPNIAEAEALTGVTIKGLQGMQQAADRLLLGGASAVLIKGGHLEGDSIVDLLRTADGLEHRFEGPRVGSRTVHGTGCTLASAIATYLAHGFTLESAIAQARDYVVEAIARALPLGHGAALLDHAWPRYHQGEN